MDAISDDDCEKTYLQIFQVAAGTWSGDKSNLSRRQSCPCHVRHPVLHSPVGWHTPPNQDIWDSPGLPPEEGWISPPPAPPSGWNSPSSCSCSSADQELPISCFDNESRLHCSHSSPLNLECSHRASRGLDCSISHLSESCCRHGSEHYTEEGFGDAVDEENTYYRKHQFTIFNFLLTLKTYFCTTQLIKCAKYISTLNDIT